MIWLCTSCGFHTRSAYNLPPSLKTIAVRMPGEDKGFQADIRQLLTSLNIRIKSNAPFVLNISDISFSHSQPNLISTEIAVTYNYTMTMTFSILKGEKKIIPNKTLSASRNIIMNVNQVYTSAVTELARRELSREIINLLYYQLISQEMKNALQMR